MKLYPPAVWIIWSHVPKKRDTDVETDPHPGVKGHDMHCVSKGPHKYKCECVCVCVCGLLREGALC